MKLDESRALYARARTLIPGGIPGIRAPENFVPGRYPILLAGGRGGRITDVDGNELVDLLCGYGPVLIGHAEPEIDAAAHRSASNGFCLNLPEPAMIDLVELLTRRVPSAEQGLIVKTGSDATSAAVRIARAHTGRDIVLRCGYHGWHDWCVEGGEGVPAAYHSLTVPFAYNDLTMVQDLLRLHAGRVAAIIVTPVGHDFDRQIEPPAAGFLEGLRAAADMHGAVLVFDEVRSGFRLAPGGAQELYGVTPDLTALGKALGNGYPISALVGSRAVMQAATRTFISSTYFPNGMEMAAAIATLTLLDREPVLADIRRFGTRLRDGLSEIVKRRGLPVTLSPYVELPFLHFTHARDDAHVAVRDRFYGALAERGVFAHPRHHGFVCWRHDDRDLQRVLEAADAAAALC